MADAAGPRTTLCRLLPQGAVNRCFVRGKRPSSNTGGECHIFSMPSQNVLMHIITWKALKSSAVN